MNWSRRSIALLLALATLAGCASAPSSRGSGSGGSAPRVRCLTDPARDDASTSRPLFFLFCLESP